MRVRTQCRSCGLPFAAEISPDRPELACPGCGETRPIRSDGWSDSAGERRVEVCPLCGCEHLYRQRDFNRALGCLLVAVGAALVPWTYGLSLVLLGLVDLALYYRLAESVVCYRCDTVYRDAAPTPRQQPINLLKHDVVKYGKTWTPQEVKRAERERRARGAADP